jgi:ADP-ribose pyrophosphatase YjhB (NUDIX family)
MYEQVRGRAHVAALTIWRRLPLRLQALALRILAAPTPVGALAIIRDDAGRILFVHQTYRSDDGWSVPGGFLKRNEEPRDAAVRETREEVGLEVRAGALLAVGRGEWGDIRIAYACEPVDGRAPTTSAEVDRIAYFAPEEVPPLPPALRAFILEAVRAQEGKPPAVHA